MSGVMIARIASSSPPQKRGGFPSPPLHPCSPTALVQPQYGEVLWVAFQSASPPTAERIGAGSISHGGDQDADSHGTLWEEYRLADAAPAAPTPTRLCSTQTAAVGRTLSYCCDGVPVSAWAPGWRFACSSNLPGPASPKLCGGFLTTALLMTWLVCR